MKETTYSKLENRIKKLNNIGQARSIIEWDQEVIMPEKGAKPRSQQISTLSEIHHQKLTSEKTKEILNSINKEKLDDEEQANYREFKRSFDRSSKIPTDLQKKISEKRSESVENWNLAKEESDFEKFLPHLKEMIELKKQYAAHIDDSRPAYQVLFEDYEPYMEFERVEKILKDLKKHLKNQLEKIEESDLELEQNPLKSHEYDIDKQEELSRNLAEKIGFKWEKGVFKTSSHPFTSGNQFDTRITTRYKEENLKEGLTATIHETGHALYQQGLPEEKYGLPTGTSRELSIHESQSRFWENHIARTQEFWENITPKVKEKFPQLENYSSEEFYKGVNEVKPDNKIRIEADELTYHLHIILRFEIGQKLVNGELEPENLPEAWNDKMEELLDVRPENDAEGCLQDIHWAWGEFGYFPTYSIGSVIAAQLDHALRKDIENVDSKIKEGQFDEILEWHRENIHVHGQRFPTEELVEQATGEKPTAKYFKKYIERKYSDLYNY